LTRLSRKYVLDTQLFIQAFRDQRANTALQDFHRACAPFEYLSVIVAQELRSGIQHPQDRRALEKNVLGIFARANRTITPSAGAWHRSGDLLAAMARQEGLQIAGVSKAFANDVLLAVSCREAGCMLVTDNVRDFQRIRRFVQFDFTGPWPGIPPIAYPS
jgi:predicted nucleic acid-binding protein